jgi:hypothetical protein
MFWLARIRNFGDIDMAFDKVPISVRVRPIFRISELEEPDYGATVATECSGVDVGCGAGTACRSI